MCSTEQLLVFDNSRVLLRAPGKRPQEATHHSLGNCVFWTPPPLGISVTLRRRGGGVSIVSVTTQWITLKPLILELRVVVMYLHNVKNDVAVISSVF